MVSSTDAKHQRHRQRTGSRAKLNANRQVVHGLEPRVRELQQQTALSRRAVANNDVLEQVLVW